MVTGKGRSTIKDIADVFKEGELDEKVECRDFRLTSLHGAIEGKIPENNIKQYEETFRSYFPL